MDPWHVFNKNDVKDTWKILNNVIKKKSGTCTSFPEVNGTTISDKMKFQMVLTIFFVNIGPNLVNIIVPPSGDESIFYYRKALVTDYMFLFDTAELEITKIVRKCKPKNLLDIMVLT